MHWQTVFALRQGGPHQTLQGPTLSMPPSSSRSQGASDAVKQHLADRLGPTMVTMVKVLATDASVVSEAVVDVPAEGWCSTLTFTTSTAHRLHERLGYGSLAAASDNEHWLTCHLGNDPGLVIQR